MKSSEERVFAGKTYTFNLPVYNYGATAQDNQFQGDTGTDISGLYGYGQGAAIAEVDPDYFLIRFQTVEVLDPAIVGLAPAGTPTGRGSGFYHDWSPASAKLDDLAIFSFDIDAFGHVSAVALAQAGRGYFASTAGSADVLYSIPGNNPVEPGGSQAKVRLMFEAGSLQSVSLVDGGSGYSLVANAITQENSNVDPAAPEGSTNSPVAGLLIGLNIELEEQYTLAAKAPDDQPLYSDWYLQAVTEASVQSSAATAASPYGSFGVLVQPRSVRARELLAGAIPLTTGYSGTGQQQVFSRPQAGSVVLLDRNGQQISSLSSGQVRNGMAEFVLADLPAPGPLSAMFDGDPLSSYLVNFRPSTNAVMLDLGRWNSDVSVVRDDELRTLAFGEGHFVTAIRSDAGSGGLDLSLVRVDEHPSEAETATRLLQDAFGSAANALTTQRVFRGGDSGWAGTEGAAMGGGSLGSAFITPGSWRPVASRDGSELALRDLKAVGNAIQADFEGGVQALLTVSGSGIADTVTGLSLTVRRLGANHNGLAFYEADPVTGALLAGPDAGRLPGQTGYAAAALAQAQQSGLVLRAADLPGFGQQTVLADVPLWADRNYGLLLLANDDAGSLFSSYDIAPAGAGQFVAFAAEGRGITYGIEDVLVSNGRCDRDFNDLVVTLTSNAPIVLA